MLKNVNGKRNLELPLTPQKTTKTLVKSLMISVSTYPHYLPANDSSHPN